MEDKLTVAVRVWCAQCGEETNGVIIIRGLRWIDTVDGFFLTVDGPVCRECFGKAMRVPEIERYMA